MNICFWIFEGLYAGPVVGFFLGGIVAKYWGHYSIYYASGKKDFYFLFLLLFVGPSFFIEDESFCIDVF